MNVTVRKETDLAVLPHLSGNVITVLQLVDESLTLVIQEQTTDTTERLSSQELDLCVGFVGINQTSRVNLDLLEINGAGANSHSHLLTITGTVVAVGGWEVVVLWPVLLQEGVLSEVGSVTTSSEDDGAVCSLRLAVVGVLRTNDGAMLVLDEFGDPSPLLDLDAFRVADGEILETFHLGVGDDHARELSVTTVGTRLGVTTETGDLGEVKTELVLQPVHSIS